ncbi:DUF5677 domain-containing protein [Hydromonas duriensis]|uniref:Uncharacterized protein n=1 Tax=Hydromonas duriensis TaxID=1527608 RepID=A0A4V3DJN6_9BURK|nr:DUF5677 domain-containing protein [Hydromonas duriensis]TDR30923.1 hypothetical protein DFR44_11539 [Hydromonas duriensis]
MPYTAEDLHTQCEHAAQIVLRTPFDNSQPAQILAVGLFVRAVETVGAALVIYPTHFHSAIMTLARTLLEATAQLGFLSKNPKLHYDALHLMDLEEKYLRLDASSQPHDDLSELRQAIEQYKHKGIKRPSLKKMLTVWGYADVYESYRFLSQHSHTSLTSIADLSIQHAHIKLGSRMSEDTENAIFGLMVELLKEGEKAFLYILTPNAPAP